MFGRSLTPQSEPEIVQVRQAGHPKGCFTKRAGPNLGRSCGLCRAVGRERVRQISCTGSTSKILLILTPFQSLPKNHARHSRSLAPRSVPESAQVQQAENSVSTHPVISFEITTLNQCPCPSKQTNIGILLAVESCNKTLPKLVLFPVVLVDTMDLLFMCLAEREIT